MTQPDLQSVNDNEILRGFYFHLKFLKIKTLAKNSEFTVTTRLGDFWPQGHTKLGRGPLVDATYQIYML